MTAKIKILELPWFTSLYEKQIMALIEAILHNCHSMQNWYLMYNKYIPLNNENEFILINWH